MSKHIGRKQRWTREGPTRFTSRQGSVVYTRDAWYALLNYGTGPPAEAGAGAWEAHARRLGPFSRPRDAMVALEREATALENRHGEGVRFLGDSPAG